MSAFPLTPLNQGRINFRELTSLIKHIDGTGATSIGVLGSTGSYMYLTTAQRTNVLRCAADSTDLPVIAGISDLTLENVLKHTASAHKAGASALMLAPVGYQTLTPDEVYGLFYQVDRATDLPIVLYDNPSTTGFTFTDDLYRSISALESVQSIKIPPPAKHLVGTRVQDVVQQLPETAIGISGDHIAVDALAGGAHLWYSVVAGTLPELALALAYASKNPEREEFQRVIKLAQPLFSVFTEYGSYRTVDALALIAGLIQHTTLQLPIKSIPAQTQHMLKEWYDLYRGYAKKGFPGA